MKEGLVKVLRTFPDGENWPCHMGSGECSEPAVEAHDNGAGGEFLVCAKHAKEVRLYAKIVEGMGPEQLKKFQQAIEDNE